MIITFSKQERDLWLLCVKSQLDCQFKVKLDWHKLARVNNKYKGLRYDVLYRKSQKRYPQKKYVDDLQYFQEVMN